MGGDIPYRNTKLMMFPDDTLETQRQCRSFDTESGSESREFRYSILFPAKLRVVDGETVWT